MARVDTPRLQATTYNDYVLSSPGWGGLNIADLEYDILDNQSPDMINMMVADGALGKRYGQSKVDTTGETLSKIIALGQLNNVIYVQANNAIYAIKDNTVTKLTDVEGNKGTFYVFNQQLLFMNGTQFLAFDENGLVTQEPYIPEIVINRKPDASYEGDLMEKYNRLTSKFKNTFDGDGTSTIYHLTSKDLQGNETEPLVNVIVFDEEWTYGASIKGFTVDWTNGTVTFTEAPKQGVNNVVITASQSLKQSQEYINSITKCKYMYSFGGNNNSRLFVAGNGSSCYYYSDVYDASYFPESQNAAIGNGTDDITGFGEQYSTFIVFKPDQVYGITYSFDEAKQEPVFDTYTINSLIGCDCPYTISMVNNQLTWLNSTYGVCTMLSTTIKDEKNIVYISRNINSGMKQGLLDYELVKEDVAFNFDGKYWLCQKDGNVFVWDYELTPYTYSGFMDKDALRLAWFKFDNMFINCAVVIDENVFYGNNDIMTLDNSLSDYVTSSTNEDKLEAIVSRFKTKMLDFGYIDYLKTVKKMYVDVRGDTPSLIKVKYVTGENPEGEYDPEDIIIYSKLWKDFSWDTFGWEIINFKKEFARNVSLKKISIFGIIFENNQLAKDMSISSIKLKWFISQKVR